MQQTVNGETPDMKEYASLNWPKNMHDKSLDKYDQPIRTET